MTALREDPREVRALEALLRASRAVRNAYQRVIDRIERDRDRQAIGLRVIQRDHRRHAAFLESELRALGGEPGVRPGLRGAVVQALEDVAMLFGVTAALRALHGVEGEDARTARAVLYDLHGRRHAFVRDTILPELSRHIELLDAMRGLVPAR